MEGNSIQGVFLPVNQPSCLCEWFHCLFHSYWMAGFPKGWLGGWIEITVKCRCVHLLKSPADQRQHWVLNHAVQTFANGVVVDNPVVMLKKILKFKKIAEINTSIKIYNKYNSDSWSLYQLSNGAKVYRNTLNREHTHTFNLFNSTSGN